MRAIVLWQREEPGERANARPRLGACPPSRQRSGRARPEPLPPEHRLGAAASAAALRRDLARLLRPVADACGPDSPVFRLVCRGVYGPTADARADLKRLRLARFAVDQLPAAVRRQLAARPGRAPTMLGPRGRPAIAARPPADRAPTILVVDHRAERAGAVAAALQDAGYRVLRVTDARSARTAVALLRPCLAVVDVLLPATDEVDGTTLVARLLARGMPVVVCCSLKVAADRPDLVFVRRAGDRDELLAAVARLLWGPSR